jgi:hypothetical protein
MIIGMGEERTTGSDTKIRFSSGGPISLNHFSTMFERGEMESSAGGNFDIPPYAFFSIGISHNTKGLHQY